MDHKLLNRRDFKNYDDEEDNNNNNNNNSNNNVSHVRGYLIVMKMLIN